MSKNVKTIRKENSATAPHGWDQAIRDARDLLVRVEERADRIRGAIRTFTEYRNAGEPYSNSVASRL